MRKACWLQVAFLGTTLMFGQTLIDLRTQTKSVDFSGATATKPLKSGAVLPSTCGSGEMFFLTSAPAGANVFGCASLNSWTLQTGAILPSVAGNGGKLLSTDGTNYLWTTLGGDLSGTPGSASVLQIQGRPVSNSTPSAGQFLGWTGSGWAPQTPPSGNPTLAGDVNGPASSSLVVQIQGHPVSSTLPLTGQTLTWSGSAWTPQIAGGSAASMASQLGDFLVARTGSTTLSIGANCSSATPCSVRFGAAAYTFTSASSVVLSGGTGVAFIYITNSGTLTVGHNLTLSCGGGCLPQSGVSTFPADTIPLFSWSATNGSWNASGLDQRAFLSFKEVTNGAGISVVPDAQGHTVISADASVIPLRVTVPATSAASCSPGAWAASPTFLYLCVNQNQWLRAALSSW